ncbi:hypothetical protein EDC01DRAFT_40783 [Geopyxis carbonaria]|nr:hypothetical protein EDC01DRAFT_40783 [Geopyxis carbonaria]
MGLWLGKNFKPVPISDQDKEIALIVWGFTLGFLYLTAWKTWKQTSKMQWRKRYMSTYVWLVWLEVFSNLCYAMSAWLYLMGRVEPGFWIFFFIWASWAFQIQCQTQIIINRINIILMNRRRAFLLRWITFSILLAIIIGVACIWIPAALQLDPIFASINAIYDKCEKVVYLGIDFFLNWFFVRTVKAQLVQQGIRKYDALVRFNVRIVFLSLAMDLLIIGMMFYPNPYVYLQFHPLAFTVKLNIELSMALLIAKIARTKDGADERDGDGGGLQYTSYELSGIIRDVKSGPGTLTASRTAADRDSGLRVMRTQEVNVDVESIGSAGNSAGGNGVPAGLDSDEAPLADEMEWGKMGHRAEFHGGA